MIRIGIDVGGTGIQFGAVDKDLKIIAEESIPTNTHLSIPEQIAQMAAAVVTTAARAGFSPDQIESVGVGIPGIANPKTGEIDRCPNMGWFHVPFREEFRKHLSITLFIENDANVAALAESVAGVSAGTSSSVFVTIGTGIGSGIINPLHLRKPRLPRALLLGHRSHSHGPRGRRAPSGYGDPPFRRQ